MCMCVCVHVHGRVGSVKYGGHQGILEVWRTGVVVCVVGDCRKVQGGGGTVDP